MIAIELGELFFWFDTSQGLNAQSQRRCVLYGLLGLDVSLFVGLVPFRRREARHSWIGVLITLVSAGSGLDLLGFLGLFQALGLQQIVLIPLRLIPHGLGLYLAFRAPTDRVLTGPPLIAGLGPPFSKT